jgi:hypothetical protein
MVLLGINLIWDIFANANKTPKHFLLGIIANIWFFLKNAPLIYGKIAFWSS